MIAFFTPIHKFNEEHLDFLFSSLQSQTRKNFIWYILLNGEVLDDGDNYWRIIDRYVNSAIGFTVSVRATITTNNIGSLKRECCDYIINEFPHVKILAELDYDDALHADCVQELTTAHETSGAKFYFTNFAHFGEDNRGRFTSFTYGKYWGWRDRKHADSALFEGKFLNETIAYPGLAQYMYRIESAPNHLRAFTVEGYNQVGGHDSLLEVGDDHDLMCRFYKEYGESGFHHIDRCLYYQRYDTSTTTHSRNADIQRQVDVNYINHSEGMFKKWAKDNRLACLDFGGRFNSPNGYVSVDLRDSDIIMDLNGHWSFSDHSVGVIRAYHILEHLDDPVHFFNEAYRVLAPGGFLLVEVPSARGMHAFADPTHKHFFTELNFDYYTDENKAKFIRPDYKGAFQNIRTLEYAWDDGTLCISAQMIALKGWYNDRHWGDKKTDESYIQA